jgi:hypothetical protein
MILTRVKKSWRNKLPENFEAIPKNDATTQDLINLHLPNGMKLNAAGQWTIFILSLTCAAIYFCERFSKVVLYICTRLNNNPDRADFQRRQ